MVRDALAQHLTKNFTTFDPEEIVPEQGACALNRNRDCGYVEEKARCNLRVLISLLTWFPGREGHEPARAMRDLM